MSGSMSVIVVIISMTYYKIQKKNEFKFFTMFLLSTALAAFFEYRFSAENSSFNPN